MPRLPCPRRALRAGLALAIASLLIDTPQALARGGGGSFGFGGGGGGGGGGHGFGGHFPVFIPIGGGGVVFFIFVVAILIAAATIRAQRPPGTTPSASLHVSEHLRATQTVFGALNPFARRRRRARQERVELAAQEASLDDPQFAPEVVHAEAEQLFRNVQNAWSINDRERLRRLVGPELFEEWARRLADFARQGWRNEVTVEGPVEVDYVGLQRGATENDDHVVVWITARLRDIVVDGGGNRITRKDSDSEVSRMSEYWTLSKRDGHWIVVSIEQEREGRHELSEPIIATPWSDTARLQEQSLAEQAAAEKLPEGYTVADVASPEFANDARAAALDLSMADGRFAPDLLAAEVKRTVAAWSGAVDGDREALAELSSPEALSQLLHPGDPTGKTRLVVRGLQVRGVRIVALEAQATPVEMTVEVEVKGSRYIEDRDTTAVVSGNPNRAAVFRERWRLALDGDDAHPWRIVGAE